MDAMTDPATPAARRRRLGATPLGGTTRFEVWAPGASTVQVVVDTTGGSRVVADLDRHPASVEATSSAATWTATVEGVGAGDRYRYRLDSGDLLPDPASRLQHEGVHGPSTVVDTDEFEWTDAGWTGIALADTVLYELHIGTFTPEGTFEAAIGQLDRLVALGITTIEIMPVAAFPGRRNWGYDGVFPFATQATYGGPDGLARLVDAAHARGLAVVLDVVYNHFGPEGNVLPRFGPYLTGDYSTPWGEAINVAGRHSDSVRRFCIENAVAWITNFHLDGLRVDAVHAIVDPTARPFIDELTAAVHDAASELGRTVLVTVESSSNDPRLVRPHELGGWSCDAVWNDDYHHALRVALTGEHHEYYAAYTGAVDVAEAWQQRLVYHGRHSVNFGRRHGAEAGDVDHRHFVVFAQNHDHVGNTPRGERMLHDAGPGDPRLRLAAACVLLSPFTPMLFMGEEYGERAPFPYFIDHGDADLVEAVRNGRRAEFSGVDWSGGVADPAAPDTYAAAVLDPSLASSGAHRELLEWYTELLSVRRTHTVLTDRHAEQRVRLDDHLLVVERRRDDSRSVLLLNLGDHEHADRWTDDGQIVADSSAGTAAARDHEIVAPWSARLRIRSGPG